jgi:hypothetical protein
VAGNEKMSGAHQKPLGDAAGNALMFSL